MMQPNNWWLGYGAGLGFFVGWLGMLLVPFLVWSLFWKGWALWKAAREENKVWFIILLVVNTLGILEILYIFVFSKKPEKSLSLTTKKTGRRK